jgi:hypothetical protein
MCWEDRVLEDARNVDELNWKKVAQNGDGWEKLVERAGT